LVDDFYRLDSGIERKSTNNGMDSSQSDVPIA